MSINENELAYDPIISFYLKLSKSGDDIPLFSETMLRLSFKEVFGSLAGVQTFMQRPLNADELGLYRKLLLLHFSISYSDLPAIMTCFDENTIPICLRDREKILIEWCQFFNDKLASIVYKESLYEMLLEYTIRYIKLFGHISKVQLRKKIKEIQSFQAYHVKIPRHFFITFYSLLKNKLAQNQHYKNLTQNDLELRKIFEFIKHKLNYFVVKEVPEDDDEEEPPSKKSNNTSTEDIKPIVLEDESVNDEIRTSEGISNEDISNEHISNEFYVYDDCDDDEINYVEINDEDNKPNHTEEEEWLNLDIVDINSNSNERIISYNTALKYLAALQAYAVVNDHIEAIDLLDNVDGIFRTKNIRK